VSRLVLRAFCLSLLLSFWLAWPSLSPPAHAKDELSAYRAPARQILGEALLCSEPYQTLSELCDRYGNRLSGSQTLDNAIDWAIAKMKAQGLTNVHREEVEVPHWVRGEEKAWLTTPTTRHRLNILGLGMSVGTPPGGTDAEVVVVSDFDELNQRGEKGKLKGKIVLYDAPFVSYGKTVRYRVDGPSRAAAFGAVAVLVRSVGPISYDTPHTGTLLYDEDQPKIPAAAVTIEGATLMHRLQERGDTMSCHLEMGAHMLEDAKSANVVADYPGSEVPEEVVVLGGHLDSWDVGQGAQDDGVGSIIAWGAVRTLQRLGIHPRRTIRLVLFTNEENADHGGKDYARRHAAELANHIAAIESDSGNGLADGFRLDLRAPGSTGEEEKSELSEEQKSQLESERALAIDKLQRFAPLFEPLGSTRFFSSYSGTDVGPMVVDGVVGLGLDHDTTKYFEIHHTNADTFDKIVEKDLRVNVGSMALMAYILAQMPGRLREVSAAAMGTH
jgi:carboxypeptidase Q